MNSKYKCVYCARSYKIKENFKKHEASCKLFHENQLTHPDDFLEPIPDTRQLYIYIRELASKCASLEQEAAQLKQHANIKQKKQIIQWLNTNRIPNPNISLMEWIQNNIRMISYENLEIVFKNDLTHGIYHMLECLIHDNKNKTIPLCAFTQKPLYLYAYIRNEDGVLEWSGMSSGELEKMVFYISQQFLITFVKWQKENYHRIANSEKLKDDEIGYMIKINGSRISMEKRCADLKKRVYTLLEEDLQLCEFV